MSKPWQGALFICAGLAFMQTAETASKKKAESPLSSPNASSAQEAPQASDALGAKVLGPGSSISNDNSIDDEKVAADAPMGTDLLQSSDAGDEDSLGDLSPRDFESGETPTITCHQLITGTLDVPGDGRANVVCDRAMEICIAYVSLKKLMQNRTVPFSENITQDLFQYLKQRSLNWRRICEITRKAYTDPDFSSVLTVDPPAKKKQKNAERQEGG